MSELPNGSEEFLRTVLKEAGEIAAKAFLSEKEITTKQNRNDLLTKTDTYLNGVIVERIHSAFPNHGIISEELPRECDEAEWVWIVDPIDGTRNFATNNPYFGIMVALTRHGEPQLAGIYSPLTNELLFARKGKGATLNGDIVSCSLHPDIANSRAISDSRISEEYKPWLISLMRSNSFSMYCYGAAVADCLFVANGRCDWAINRRATPWDNAPVALILSEAGCMVSEIDGSPWNLNSKTLLAANPVLHKKIIEAINK